MAAETNEIFQQAVDITGKLLLIPWKSLLTWVSIHN